MIGPAEIEDMLLDLEAAELERKAALGATGTTNVVEGETTSLLDGDCQEFRVGAAG